MNGFVTRQVERVFKRAKRMAAQVLARDFVSGATINRSMCKLVKIGSTYGGWVIPAEFLNSDSICYCVGVGEDNTFDLGLIERYGCQVWAFDPTPRAISHVAKNGLNNPLYRFSDIGLWDKDETLRFYAPNDPQHVSHSIVNLQKTESYFEAKCQRLSRVMLNNQHSKIDLLKLDIEGAEYKVIDSILEDEIEIKVLCVEFDELFNSIDSEYKLRVSKCIHSLLGRGYKLVSLDGTANYTFLMDS